eukprot:1180106-Prorocentrum_minimum.AAC.6
MVGFLPADQGEGGGEHGAAEGDHGQRRDEVRDQTAVHADARPQAGEAGQIEGGHVDVVRGVEPVQHGVGPGDVVVCVERRQHLHNKYM